MRNGNWPTKLPSDLPESFTRIKTPRKCLSCKKLRLERRGFEPLTSAVRLQRSTAELPPLKSLFHVVIELESSAGVRYLRSLL
jgi:hypothetical protein